MNTYRCQDCWTFFPTNLLELLNSPGPPNPLKTQGCNGPCFVQNQCISNDQWISMSIPCPFLSSLPPSPQNSTSFRKPTGQSQLICTNNCPPNRKLWQTSSRLCVGFHHLRGLSKLLSKSIPSPALSESTSTHWAIPVLGQSPAKLIAVEIVYTREKSCNALPQAECDVVPLHLPSRASWSG